MKNEERPLNLYLALAGIIPPVVALAVALPMVSLVWSDLEPKPAQSLVYAISLLLGPALLAGFAGLMAWLRHLTLPGAVILWPLVQAFIFYIYLRWLQVPLMVREWLFDTDAFMTVLLLGSLPVFYTSLFYLGHRFAIRSRRTLIATIIAAVVLPALLYLTFQVARYMRVGRLADDMAPMLLITASVVFSFLLVRLLVYAFQKNREFFEHARARIAMRILFIGVFPLVGLLMNRVGPLANESQSVLGDFTHPAFWILSVVNAVVFLLPQPRQLPLRVALLFLRSAGIFFVLYFCLVFLVFLPLALLLIAALGIGLLLLVPYLALAAQLAAIKENFREWRTSPGLPGFVVVSVTGFMAIPVFSIALMFADRARLGSVIEFLQTPPLSLNAGSPIDAQSAARFAQKKFLSRRGFRRNENRVPVFDAVYDRIVFDGFGLSETLRLKIRSVFMGDAPPTAGSRSRAAEAVLESLEVKTRTEGSVSKSQVRVRVANPAGLRDTEFETPVRIPGNALVTGHWLNIDGKEVPAQITSRSAAIWVYNRVQEQRRDPSLIWFEGRNRLRWRIFPVPPRGIREARLEITHLGNAAVHIGRRTVDLTGTPVNELADLGNAGKHLVAENNSALVTRKPYLHFVVDCSAKAPENYATTAQKAFDRLALPLKGAMVSYVNSSIHTELAGSLDHLRCANRKAGFFLDRALRAILYEARQSSQMTVPVVVVLSPTHPDADWNGISHFAAFYPDLPVFYHATGAGLQAYNFYGEREHFMPAVPRPVRAIGQRWYPQQTVVADGAARIDSPLFEGASWYERSLLGDATARSQAILAAIRTGVLNPAAASIVLETEAQRQKLAEMHKKTLHARNPLEVDDRPRMSEPRTWLLLCFLLVLAWWQHARRRGKAS